MPRWLKSLPFALLLVGYPNCAWAQAHTKYKPDPSAPNTPAFTSDPLLEEGFHNLYVQKFGEARQVFQQWSSQNPNEPFGPICIAASFLFEEFYLQHVLTSEYFLDDKRFIGGITGSPDPARMKNFQDAVARARKLAFDRLKSSPRDPEGLYALTLSAGMESDADSMLLKKHLDALKRLKEANSNAEMLSHWA
jgi:hypothetical protein